MANHHQIKTASAVIYDIPCGDTDMFNTTMHAVVPGDVVLLDGNSCVYDFGPDYKLERDRVYTSTGSQLFGVEDGIIIKGKVRSLQIRPYVFTFVMWLVSMWFLKN